MSLDIKSPDDDDEIWMTADGNTIKIKDMSEEHAKNCLRMMIRRSREYKFYSSRRSFKECLHDIVDLDIDWK